MPIRMEKDDPQDQRRSQNQRPRRPGGNNISRLLPYLLMFVFKRPKLLIPLAIIGAVWYFFLGGSDMFSTPMDDQMSEFSFGATLDEAKYDEAMVFEPLAYGNAQNALPSRVSLKQFAPDRLHQGRQGSCVGWASSYAARTILQAQATRQAPNQLAFSPSFLYNQIALRGCQGAYMLDAMESMEQVGALPFQQFPYDERSCTNRPNSNQQRSAQEFRIKGYNRLTLGANNYTPDMEGIKQHLNQGAPVVIGMQVGGTFMHQMRGKQLWQPTQRDYSMYGYSGHAMCVIGYDDNYQGGAFQIMNSWGDSWGDDGIAWVRYNDFRHFVKEAYGLFPMGNSEQFDPNRLLVKFGLVQNETQRLIPLKAVGSGVFRTKSPIQVGEKFKIAVTNSVECFIYVFGEETDGSSYTLFPYTQKHSSYCGITGTRLFPKDYSMVADNLGNRDRIAVVVSKEELNYTQLNDLINQAPGGSYAEKVNTVLRDYLVQGVNFQAGDAISLDCQTDQRKVVAMVLEIDKQ
jgi:C1A family cysteine protease